MITTKQGTKIQLNTIEEAIADIKQGKVIICLLYTSDAADE